MHMLGNSWHQKQEQNNPLLCSCIIRNKGINTKETFIEKVRRGKLCSCPDSKNCAQGDTCDKDGWSGTYYVDNSQYPHLPNNPNSPELCAQSLCSPNPFPSGSNPWLPGLPSGILTSKIGTLWPALCLSPATKESTTDLSWLDQDSDSSTSSWCHWSV